MKIIHVCPPFLPLSREMRYGGTERIILSLMARQALEGHELSVIAPSDSTVAGLMPTVESIGLGDIYASEGKNKNSAARKQEHVAKFLEYAQAHQEAFLHIHDDVVFPYLDRVRNPYVFTVHCTYDEFWQSEKYPALVASPRNMVAISQSHRRIFESHGYAIRSVVYNGIDVEDFSFSAEKDDFLFSLSVIAPHKGQKIAVQAARSAGTSLVMAGNIGDDDYFESFMSEIDFDISRERDKYDAYKSLPSGKKVVYAGTMNDFQKKPFYSMAKAFLMPVQWEEPFGLVMVEALASGTPVIGFNRGSVPEVVSDEETGFVVSSLEGMVDAIDKIGHINPQKCRERSITNFSSAAMARNYLGLYQRILQKHY